MIANYYTDPLVNAVLQEIKKDMAADDDTVVLSLLARLPVKELIAVLPEKKAAEFVGYTPLTSKQDIP